MPVQRFSSRLQKLSRGFLDQRLKGAVGYDRIAGYFRSSIFEIAGEAYEQVAGPIRIICNSGLDVRDVDTAKGLETALRSDWCAGAPERMVETQRPRYDRLAKLLRSGKVEVKVLPDESFGLIHGKAGVIRYSDRAPTCFLGSNNETGEGWSRHYELMWEDDDPAAVAWVQAEFDALWVHPNARKLADVVVEDVERILKRRIVQVAEWQPAEEEQAPFIEAPVERQGSGLAPHQRSFVARVVHDLDVYGQARFLLADDVGLGKTVQLGMAAEIVALLKGGPVLILAPKNLLSQWQDELRRMLAVPSARWLNGCWITEDGAEWKSDPTSCPRSIGLFPTSLITAGSASAHALLSKRYTCVVLDEAHRARRSRAGGREGDANKLLEFMLKMSVRTETLLLGTATPIQTDRMELFDLMVVMHHGCERVLGDFASNWRTRPDDALDLVAGTLELSRSASELWGWFKDPLIPRGEATLANQIRDRLGLGDAEIAAPSGGLDRLGPSLVRALEARGAELLRQNNPFVRHVIKRRRRDLKNPDGSSVFRDVPVNLHGERDDDALLMPDHMGEAYEEARAYCNALAKTGSGATAGFMKTLLLRRIGSSLRAGLSTARKLLTKDLEEVAQEEDGEATAEMVSAESEAEAHLRKAIGLLEAAGDNDPKLGLVLKYLRNEGWADRGCIMFSQYLDTVMWIAGHLATAFPDRRVGVYGGQGNCFLWEDGYRRGAERDEIQKMVQDGRLRLLVATDAASEGLNLQRLSTLINIDLPWNPARLEQRKGRIDRIGQQAASMDVLNLRYRGSVEDDVHKALSGRLKSIREVFGTVPDTLEDVWVLTAMGDAEEARRKIEQVPNRHPFEMRYANDVPATAWERCIQVLDKQDVQRALKAAW
jgi:superfamily II DNA or RNA helicase